MRVQQLPWTLASASPRRLALLRQVGIEPVVAPSDIPEIENGDRPENIAVRNAAAKADAVEGKVKEGILLAADTVVVVDGESLGKPATPEDARAMLQRLSGREHEVHTGFSLRWLNSSYRLDSFERTLVEMRTLRSGEIDAYIESGEPFDKAGGYGIQGAAAAFVTRLSGCYFNVVGLPVARIVNTVAGWLDAASAMR